MPSVQSHKNISIQRHALMMKKYWWLIYGVGTFLAILIMAHSVESTSTQILLAEGAEPQGSALYLELTTRDINQFIGTTLESLALLAFIALLMERALEVFVIGFRSHNKMYLEQEIRHWEQLAQQAQEAQENKENADRLPACDEENKLKESKESLTQEKAKTKTQIQLIALLVGVTLGLAGIRMLEPIFSTDSLLAMPNIQQILFRFLDIAITGLAVAGGSDGIHIISKRLGDSLGTQNT